jgi:hypothetical protein
MPSHIDASILMKKSERLMLEKKNSFPTPALVVHHAN